MAVAFKPGQEIGRGDLDIFLKDSNNAPTNPAEITYSLYYLDPGPPETEVLIGAADRTPVNPTVGEFYAALMVPAGANIGTYRIRWTIREFIGAPQMQVVQEFAVVSVTTVVESPYSNTEQELIRVLRTLLRDNAPDKNYHFRPPEHECDIGEYNRIFGYVWTDEELYTYLNQALDWWNMFPPSTAIGSLDCLVTSNRSWTSAVHYGAMSFALMALAINWVADEFSVTGDTKVKVFLPDGTECRLSIEDLYDIVN